MIRAFLKKYAVLLAAVGVVLVALVGPAAYDFLSDAGLAPRGVDVHYRDVAIRGGLTLVGTQTSTGDVTIGGTTPLLTVGDGGAEDAGIVFNGDGAQDFYIGFDNTTDDLYIGYGTVIGSNAGLTIQEDGTTTITGLVVSASPVVNAGDNTDADVGFNWDHITTDWHFEVDATDDLLYMGVGTVAGTTPAFRVNADQTMQFYQDPIFAGTTPEVTIGDAAAEDTSLVYDGIAQDYYIGLEDATDTLKLGLGQVLGTTEAMTINATLDVTWHDATASDFLMTFDGNAQDYYLGLQDIDDSFMIGVGGVMDTTEMFNMDATTLTLGLGQSLVLSDVPAADASGDYIDITDTLNANATAGTETFLLFDVNLTAGTVAVGDVIRGLDLNLTNADGDSTDTGILISGAWDVALDVQSLRVDLDSDSDSSIRASADDVLTFELGGTDFLTFSVVPAVDASGDIFDWTGTLNANATAGTETVLFWDVNLTAGTVAVGDVIRGLDLALTNADGDSTDTGILISGAWDVALDVQSLRIDLDSDSDSSLRASADDTIVLELAGSDLWTWITPAAAGVGGDLLDLTATFAAMNGSDSLIGWDINLTGANHAGTANTLTGIDLALTTPDAQATERAIVINSNWDLAMDTAAPIVGTAAVWFDDFFGDTVDPAWDTSISGTDPQAVQAIVVEQYGVYELTSGNAGTGIAVDGEGLFGGLEWSADQGSLIFETRLHLDTDILTVSICAGLTDVVGLEMPATIGGADAITTNASDGVFFCFDSRATTLQWFAIGVDTNVDATGNAATGTAPAGDTYQTLRIEVSSDGVEAKFYINGTLAITTTANSVTAATLLTPVVIIEPASSAASHVVDIDYIYVGAQRA